MEELNNIFFIIKIKESELNNAYIFALRENGDVFRLKASGFYNENSKNRSLIKEFNFYELTYFASFDIETKNKKFVKLKNGTKLFDNSFNNLKYISIFEQFSKILITKSKTNKFIFPLLLLLSKNIKTNTSILTICLIIINILFYQENYKFELTKCSNCLKTKNISGFSLKSGGVICRTCDPNHKCDLSTKTIISLMKLFILNEKDYLNSTKLILDTEEEKKIIDMYYNFSTDVLGWNLSFLKDL